MPLATAITRLAPAAKGSPGLYAGMAAGAGLAAYGALTSDGSRDSLGQSHAFWNGMLAGVAGIAAVKTGAALSHALAPATTRQLASHAGTFGRRLAGVHPFSRVHAAWDAATPLQRGAAVLVASSLPSIAMLKATSGDRKVLGQGHDFWSGAVWGIAGIGLVKGAQKLHNLPLAVGWVGGDFAALGIDGLTRRGEASH